MPEFKEPIKNISEADRIARAKIQKISIEKINEFVQTILGIRRMEEGKPSPERIDQIKKTLESVTSIMNQSGVEYQLDGALNISLYKDEFYRDHRDVDFSIFSKDLIKLIETFEINGYALFKLPKGTDEEVNKNGILTHELLRSNDIEIKNVSRQLLFFVKVNEKFEIDTQNYYPIDIHCLDQNASGDIVRPNGHTIPKKYWENKPEHIFESGEKLSLNNPLILAYNKLIQGRQHDLKDVEHMIEIQMLTRKDLLEIDKLLQEDENKLWQEGKEIIKISRDWLGKQSDAAKIIDQ